MTAEQLEDLIDRGQQPIILDVRSTLEFRSGHIPGAVHAPLSVLKRSAENVVTDKSSKLVLVCEHGPRAQFGKFTLKLSGYKNLELLDGHMAGWRRSGRKMVAN